MRNPIPARSIVDNLVWSNADASVWACFTVNPFPYAYQPAREAMDIHARTEAALLAMGKEVLILSVARQLPQAEVIDRLRAGVDPTTAPAWTSRVDATVESFAEAATFTRHTFAVARLPQLDRRRTKHERLQTAAAQIGAMFGIPAPLPSRADIASRQAQAEQLMAQLGQNLAITPTRPEIIRWLYQRAPLRGVFEPPLPPEAGSVSSAVAHLDRDAVYLEGGERGRAADPRRPRHWRYLTVNNPDYGPTHMSFHVLAEMPRTWVFPYVGRGEWLYQVDAQLPYPTDWALRIRAIDNYSARQKTLRAKRNLTGQFEEHGGDPAGAPTSLGAAIEAVEHKRERLEANPALPSMQVTVILSTTNQDIVELESQAEHLESVFRPHEFNFYRPTGGQLQAFSAMLPGSPTPMLSREYGQDLLPEGVASAMPFGGSEVGDPQGMLLGRSLDSVVPRPVLFDPAYAPTIDRSGSLAAVGQLGSGKSYFLKRVAFDTVARGSQVVVIDRTEAGEYSRLGDVMEADSQTVQLTEDSDITLDPFAVFDSDDDRLRYGVGFVTLLTGTPPSSTEGAYLYKAGRQVLEAAAAAGRQPRLFDLISYLEDAESSEAHTLADKIQIYSEISFGRLVFGDSGRLLDLRSDYVVFHLPGLKLPGRGVPRDEYLPEQVFSQALLYLVSAFSRKVLFRSSHRFAALLLDEAHALLSSQQGWSLVSDLIRDGRKHFAAVWLASQLAVDFMAYDDRTSDLDSLLGYRVVFRQSAKTAPAALEFLGLEDRVQSSDLVTDLDTGQCLFRDVRGRTGLIAIAPEVDDSIEEAINTTPVARAEPEPDNPPVKPLVEETPRTAAEPTEAVELSAETSSGVPDRRPPDDEVHEAKRPGVDGDENEGPDAIPEVGAHGPAVQPYPQGDGGVYRDPLELGDWLDEEAAAG